MRTTGADLIVTRLHELGTDALFLVPGAQIDPLCKRLSEETGPQAIVASHEISAGFMADGYARASGKTGVCLGIGSCGAANMIPAASVASIDCSPVLFLSGNIPERLQGYKVFQDGWNSAGDDALMFKNLVRETASPRSVSAISTELDRVISGMIQPFAAPAHISLPVDLQLETHVGSPSPNLRIHSGVADTAFDFVLDAITASLNLARRPCLLVGSRFASPDAAQILKDFAERYCLPVATTLSSKGLLPENHPLSLGVFGFGGSRRAHETLLGPEPDLLLVLGADFNERDTSCWDARLRSSDRSVFRVDPKKSLSKGFKADLDRQADCFEFLRSLTKEGRARLDLLLNSTADREPWIEWLSKTPRTFPPTTSVPNEESAIPLDRVVLTLQESASHDTILAVDAGFQRIFAGHYWQSRQPCSFFSACGTAPIGWAICAAIGIQIARPQQPVVVLTGDGCMAAHGMEIATMVRYRLPIVIVVCNNGGYGSVSRRLPECDLPLLPRIDWVAFGKSLGASGIKVQGNTHPGEALTQTFAEALQSAREMMRPVVLDIRTPLVPELPETSITRSALSEAIEQHGSTECAESSAI